MFCRMNRLEKKDFIDKWKSLKNEVKFTIVILIYLPNLIMYREK